MWCPPTPPQELNDVYIDLNLGMLYEEEPLREVDLPPIYVRKDLKRSRVTEMPSNLDIRRMKISRREDSPLSAPRSLFDHPGSAIQKMKRDVKMKYRSPMPYSNHNPARVASPTTRDENNALEWCIQEEYVLLQTIECIQDLPLSLMTNKAGHTPNWDLCADMVNKVSCTTRSALQCRNRFENYIIYREEGKLAVEYKRQKKTKNNYRPPIQKNFSTKKLNQQDNNKNYTECYSSRFDNIKTCAHNRKPIPKPLTSNSQNKPKHLAVIMDSGVNYDVPQSPIEIALRRADRIAKEKTKQLQSQALSAQAAQAPAAAAAVAVATTSVPAHSNAGEQLTLQQRQLVVQAQAASAGTKTVHSHPVSVPAATVNVAVTLSNNVVAATTPVVATLVTTAAAQSQPVSQTTSIVVASTLPSLTPALRQARPVSTIPIQDMVATVSQTRTVSTTTTATVVSVASFTPAQLTAARLASAGVVTIPASGVKVVTSAGGNSLHMATPTKTLSPAQINYYKQQTIMRTTAQQRIGVRDQAQVKMVQGQAKVAQVQAVSSPQGKTQFFKQATALAAKGRTDDAAVSALVKQQMARQKQTPSTITAQLLSQSGLQVQHSTATLVKTSGQNMIPIPTIAAMPQVKGTLTSQLKTGVAGSQPMRLSLPANYQQLLSKQTRPTKVTQLNKTMTGVPTQLIVQSQGNKATVAAHNMQQIQHLMKTSPAQHITVSVAPGQGVAGTGHVVLAKAGGAGTSTLNPRVLPNVGGARQTIQVVPGPMRSMSGVTQVSVPSAITGSLKMAGTTQQAFLSQVTGLQSIVRQSGMNPIRIQSSQTGPIVAVSMPQPQQNQQNTDHNQGNS